MTNPEGAGPDTIVVVMTDEGAPSSPRHGPIICLNFRRKIGFLSKKWF